MGGTRKQAPHICRSRVADHVGRCSAWLFRHPLANCRFSAKLNLTAEAGRVALARFRFAPASLTALQPSDNLVVNAMHRGGKVFIIDRCCTVAADGIAIGSVADRCLLS